MTDGPPERPRSRPRPGEEIGESGPRAGGRGRRLLPMAIGILLLASVVTAVALHVEVPAAWTPGAAEEPEADPAPRVVEVPTGPPVMMVEDTLRRGSSLGRIFRRHGYEGAEFLQIVERIREVENPRRLEAGTTVRFAARVPERTSTITVALDRDRSLRLAASGDGWRAHLDSVPVTPDTIAVGGVILSSLWNASLFGDTAKLVPGERIEIVTRLSQIYAWQVDFLQGIRSGDAFRVLIERDVRPDGSVRAARVLAAEFYNDERRLPAVRFVPPQGPEEYYDAEGEATRKAFLRAPLEVSRVTSRFNRNRYHPVLRRRTAHLGTDYGASRGTPVLATGGGVVRRAGRWGGYGNVVEIQHDETRYRTRYAHLSRIAGGIRPGVRVEQKQVIGYVGSTGLSTAPHLHYEFLVNGSRRNPARVDLPPGDPVPEAHRTTFEERRDERLALLQQLPYPFEAEDGAAGQQASLND